MKAVFVVTMTGDCTNHMSAWESVYGPATCVTHVPRGVPNDQRILETVDEVEPDVVFYIGAYAGPGVPKIETFRSVKHMAPLVNLCSDAIDPPWHQVLSEYRDADCFTLHVALDGAENEYVDVSTVTPIDPRLFDGPGPDRDIRCGFSGSVGSPRGDDRHPGATFRGRVVYQLTLSGCLTVRKRRSPEPPYADHVDFMRRCSIVLNVSYSGSGVAHQVKGRAVEAGWAGAVLLESAGSSVIDRFPGVFQFSNAKEALRFIRDVDESTIAEAASVYGAAIRAQCHPRTIYNQILEAAGVDLPLSRPAA